MAVHDRFWFLLALLLTILFHLGAVVPLSRWIDRIAPPRIGSQGIEIDLTEWRPQAPPPSPVAPIQPPPEPPGSDPDTLEKPATPDSLSAVSELEATPTPVPDPEPPLPEVTALPPEPEPILPEPEVTALPPEPEPILPEPEVTALPPEPEPMPPFFESEFAPSLLEPAPSLDPMEDRSSMTAAEKRPLSPEVSVDPIVNSKIVKEASEPVLDHSKKPMTSDEPSQPGSLVAEPAKTVVSVDPLGASDADERTGTAPMEMPVAEDDPPLMTEEATVTRSPLFLEKRSTAKALDRSDEGVDDGIPKEVRPTLRGDQPEETPDEQLQYSMNTYQWTFERYIENWVADLQRWWKAPFDYAMGQVPEGGDVWIQVHLDLGGNLLGYRVFESGVSTEMELRVIQALIGSLNRPALPTTFPADFLIINWRFIYPPLRPTLDLRR
jgi:hypothetical protein